MSANNRLVADAVALGGKRGKFNSKEMKEQSYSSATGMGAPRFAGEKLQKAGALNPTSEVGERARPGRCWSRPRGQHLAGGY